MNRETCLQLLMRLKMDNFALGKSKVFLKYYHVEHLTKLFEDQNRKIILIQSLIRRWLAVKKFKILKRDKKLRNLKNVKKFTKALLSNENSGFLQAITNHKEEKKTSNVTVEIENKLQNKLKALKSHVEVKKFHHKENLSDDDIIKIIRYINIILIILYFSHIFEFSSGQNISKELTKERQLHFTEFAEKIHLANKGGCPNEIKIDCF